MGYPHRYGMRASLPLGLTRPMGRQRLCNHHTHVDLGIPVPTPGYRRGNFFRTLKDSVRYLYTLLNKLTLLTHSPDGEGQAVLRRARQGRDAHPSWQPRQQHSMQSG